MAPQSPFGRLLLLATMAFMAVAAVYGTQVMHRPDNYKAPPRTFPQEANPKTDIIHKRAGGKVSFGYFTNWGIYGANFHILYSFADTNPTTGNIALTDSYADQEKHFPGDSWSETGNNLYGNLKQLYLLKLKRRNLKVLLSIGGWTYSQSGHFNFVTNPSARTTFINDAVKIVEDYGFDGIDIDFEFPASDAQGQGLADLFTALRTAFNQLASRKGDNVPYQLTAAVSAGQPNYQYYKVSQMNAALDYWHLMAYDYAGSWLTYADNQANVYGGSRTGYSTDSALKWYLSKGATASKITIGIPLYGRAFENTNGIGQPYNGVGSLFSRINNLLSSFSQDRPWNHRSWHLLLQDSSLYEFTLSTSTMIVLTCGKVAGATVYENTTDVSSYSYDAGKRELVSYDTTNIVRIKSQYINNNGLAGAMFWELSTDKVGAQSLVGTSVGVLGGLDQTQNHIKYPSSKWDNLRNNFNGGSGTTSAPPTNPTSPGGTCNGVGAWSAGAIYVGGQQATYGKFLPQVFLEGIR
ncbi:hypothetical protein DXG03_004733 [Asterophora parasitica]|uniref:GH18 domain-containing protein n=1 Tax=Asterophora parasitica TaxID=117018 RepID=A0A9P7KCV0_9AGAR|nr:hypothetical protein DXG03_004733 [Asterophora parasitica]